MLTIVASGKQPRRSLFHNAAVLEKNNTCMKGTSFLLLEYGGNEVGSIPLTWQGGFNLVELKNGARSNICNENKGRLAIRRQFHCNFLSLA